MQELHKIHIFTYSLVSEYSEHFFSGRGGGAKNALFLRAPLGFLRPNQNGSFLFLFLPFPKWHVIRRVYHVRNSRGSRGLHHTNLLSFRTKIHSVSGLKSTQFQNENLLNFRKKIYSILGRNSTQFRNDNLVCLI